MGYENQLQALNAFFVSSFYRKRHSFIAQETASEPHILLGPLWSAIENSLLAAQKYYKSLFFLLGNLFWQCFVDLISLEWNAPFAMNIRSQLLLCFCSQFKFRFNPTQLLLSGHPTRCFDSFLVISAWKVAFWSCCVQDRRPPVNYPQRNLEHLKNWNLAARYRLSVLHHRGIMVINAVFSITVWFEIVQKLQDCNTGQTSSANSLCTSRNGMYVCIVLLNFPPENGLILGKKPTA